MAADFEVGRGVGDLVALAVADDELELVLARRDFLRQREAELDVKVATAAAAAVVDVRELAAVDALAFLVEDLVGRAERCGEAFVGRLAVIVFDLDVERHLLAGREAVLLVGLDRSIAVNVLAEREDCGARGPRARGGWRRPRQDA